MNNELDKKKEAFLETVGEHHRNVVMLLQQGTQLSIAQLDVTKSCVIDYMRVPLMRLCDSVHQDAFNAGIEQGKHNGFLKGKAEGQKAGYDLGYKKGLELGKGIGLAECSKEYDRGFEAGAGRYKETFSKGYDAGKKAALREQQGQKGAVEIGHEVDTEAWCRILNDVGQYGFQTFSDLTGQTNAFEELHKVPGEDALLGRTKWNAWPLMLRHDYVQARLEDGVTTVQIVVNGEPKGSIYPNGEFSQYAFSQPAVDWNQFKNISIRVAKYDANCDHAMNVRVPDSKVGLFMFVDSRGNEFELKNTEYGTVIVKGDLVLGVVSSMTVIEHTHGALQQCEQYGKLTQAVFAFCKWACGVDHRALPRFMVRKVAIEGQRGFSVRSDDRGRFEVLDITGTVGVILNPHINGTFGVILTPHINGTFGVLSIDAPLEPRTREIVEAAKRTVRSKFYGNMVL